MTREHLYRRARAVFGTDEQIRIAIEECGELVVALSHMQRGRGDEEAVEECADALIVGEQVRLILGADRVDAMVAVKLARLEERVAAAEATSAGDAIDAWAKVWSGATSRDVFPETPTKPGRVVR